MPWTAKIPPIAMKPRQKKRTRYCAICTAAIASKIASPNASKETTVTMKKCWRGTMTLGSLAGCAASQAKMPAGKRREPSPVAELPHLNRGRETTAAAAIAT